MYPEPMSDADKHAMLAAGTLVLIVLIFLSAVMYCANKQLIGENDRANTYVTSHHCIESDIYITKDDLSAHGIPYVCPNGQIVRVRLSK